MRQIGIAQALVVEEVLVEQRVTRLEADVAHIRTDVADMKVDIRQLNGKVEAVNRDLADHREDNQKSFAGVERALGDLRVSVAELRDAISRNTIWLLLVAGALTATVLGVMAKGFQWL